MFFQLEVINELRYATEEELQEVVLEDQTIYFEDAKSYDLPALLTKTQNELDFIPNFGSADNFITFTGRSFEF